MPTLNYSLSSSKGDLPISTEELVSRYFFGIELTDPNGNSLSERDIEFYISAATANVEGLLNLKLKKQVVSESLSYNINDYAAWGFLPVSYPVVKSGNLYGLIGKVQQVKYPKEWLITKQTNVASDVQRQIQIVPNAGAVEHNSVVYSGISPQVGWFGQPTIPHYWTIIYCTSFTEVPDDILDVVGKLAAINIFNQLGDIILGAGIASQSIGMDGLSQSISTTSSATNAGYGARITQYLQELKQARTDLKNKYDGIVMSIL